MKNKIITLATNTIVAVITLIMVTACGGNGTFRLNGEIEGFGTGNLRVVYFDKGAVQNMTATAVDGKFAVDAHATGPVMVRLYTGNGRMIAAFNAAPGDNLEGKFSTSDPAGMELSGNDDAQRLTKFLHANADAISSGNHDSLNKAIADYVKSNSSRQVSGTLLSTYFYLPGHEAEASELISLLDEKVAKTASLRGITDITRTLAEPLDSLVLEQFTIAGRKGKPIEVNPKDAGRTVLLFTDSENRTADSITALISKLSASTKPTIQIIDISADSDTAVWNESLHSISESDSLTKAYKAVKRTWSPNPYGIMGLNEIPVTQKPWFIVADSTSKVLYRGPIASDAQKAALR